jgi:hypothetical protein
VNTPTHAALNLLVLARKPGRPRSWVVLGAVLPDLPMYVFFAYEAYGRRQSMERIFREIYFQPGWQALFDAFHSIPIFLVLGTWFLWRKNRVGQLFAASLILHSLVDWPTHLEDAHAYFWPIWREPLPGWISYWHSDSRFWLLELFICASALVLILAEQVTKRLSRKSAAVIASDHARELVSPGGANGRRRGGLRADGAG